MARSLSLTPRFSGVIRNRLNPKTVSTIFVIGAFTLARCVDRKTVKTVSISIVCATTPLKRGVNRIPFGIEK